MIPMLWRLSNEVLLLVTAHFLTLFVYGEQYLYTVISNAHSINQNTIIFGRYAEIC